MQNAVPMQVIAHIRSDFPSKFGIPRQSGLVDALKAEIIFEPPYRNPDAFRGLEGYSHIWLIWQFSQAIRDHWSPTVRPPRLGGNTRMGVFATRSPFRPNHIGLSCVRLEKVELHGTQGPILHVAGADLMDGTPIYDIKPYLPYTDAYPDAKGGFSFQQKKGALEVSFPPQLLDQIPATQQKALLAAYQHQPNRIYGMPYADFEVRFTVDGNRLTVCGLTHRCS